MPVGEENKRLYINLGVDVSKQTLNKRIKDIPQIHIEQVLKDNGTLYVGHTNNVKTRLNYHSNGTGARHTRLLAPLKLVYAEGPMDFGVAVKREHQLKKWSRAKKCALIRDDKDELRRLSRSRD